MKYKILEKMRVSFKLPSYFPRQYFSSNATSEILSSKTIRQEFVKYFVEQHDHIFIKSSPVVPFCDPSVPFVNAGMNQFKGVFLSQYKPPCDRAVNSQKCIRVGGKHNDLENVGNDGYHHTFFEMLGNWSFGDYFKEMACRMAWDLLVSGPYNLSSERLYVTYFGGDKSLNIEPDWETRDVWLNIGVPPDRILPFGSSHNFWEMGPSGPCGPCTEIHYDHEDNRKNASDRVNQGYEDLVEIWNLVFIQYNRELDGSLHKLPIVHVDTGMGLERLVAIKQGKQSNYDTDLFIPLFNAIHQLTRCPEYRGSHGKLDTHYRILADHTRMITVAIADGMFPDQNVKLRQVLRRALGIAGNSFACKKGLVAELTNQVAESLAEAYPEIGAKLKEVQLIINHEEGVYKSIKKSVEKEWISLVGSEQVSEKLNVEMIPGIVGAFKELQKFKSIEKSGQIPGELSYKLFDTYGLDIEAIQSLSKHFGLHFDVESYHHTLCNIQKQSRFSHCNEENYSATFQSIANYANEHNIAVTDDTLKYIYFKEGEEYVFPQVRCRIEAIVCDNQCVSEVASGKLCSIILNKTNMYHEAGGQISDSGYFVLEDGSHILVNSIKNIQGYLLHEIEVPKHCKLTVGDQVTLNVAVEKRRRNMQNHTATHLLNAALHNLLTVTCQKSSHVTDSYLTFEFAAYGNNFNSKHIHKIEELVKDVIAKKISVKRSTINPQQLQDLYVSHQVTLVPGEVYPNEEIHIIEILAPNLSSREACCGTHLLNTADIGDFCITALKSPGSGTRIISAITGINASNAVRQGTNISNQVDELISAANSLVNRETSSLEKVENMEVELNGMKQNIIKCEKNSVPYIFRVDCIEKLNDVLKMLKHYRSTLSRRNMETEMKNVIQDLYSRPVHDPFLVHSLDCSTSEEDMPLEKATKMCPQIPVLVIANCSNFIKARCCVPKTFISKDFTAKIWMEQVLPIFGASGFVPRGQNEKLVFNMKKKYINKNATVLINKALSSACKFAKDSLSSQ